MVRNHDTGYYKYIVVEDLGRNMRQRHVLDLKMGTKQHSPLESAAKIARKQKKCLETTSARLGVRVGGMKTQLVFKDKYFGRSLDVKGFEATLKEFMGSRAGLKELVLEELAAIKQAVLGTSWKFYGSSVLIVFDAE